MLKVGFVTSKPLVGRLKATLLVLLAALLVSISVHGPAQAEARYAALVMDADTGEILHSANPDSKKYPASLTKMMTLYMVFDALDRGKLRLTQQLAVSRHAAGQAPSKLGLQPGETISVEDAVLGLVTRSANDAAAVVAEALGGSEVQFAAMMTDRAREIGMRSTSFRNASGLPHKDQQTTARDMAVLARALIKKHAKHYHYFSTREFRYEGQPITTHNRLMLNYPGADGIKTGYIGASGFNLVASAKQQGRRLIGVVFGGSSARARDEHMAQLLDKGFANLDRGIRVAEAQHQAEEAPDVFAPPPRKHDKMAPKLAEQKKAFAERKAKTSAKATKLAQGDADDRLWSIQIGAYTVRENAQTAASRAVDAIGIKTGKIAIVPVKSGKSTVYRARLIGFSEPQARAACKTIEKKNKQDCHVLDPV
jgi:D-alanyl-D-alanine carboxypeptidase